MCSKSTLRKICSGIGYFQRHRRASRTQTHVDTGCEIDEAREIAAKIKHLHEEEGYAYEQIACLFRALKKKK